MHREAQSSRARLWEEAQRALHLPAEVHPAAGPPRTAGHRYKISKVEVLINGSWVPAVRQVYNYWEPPEGIMGDALPYRVRATDENGSVIEAPVALKAGGQDSVQFECN